MSLRPSRVRPPRSLRPTSDFNSVMRRLGLYLGRLPGFDKSGFDRNELIECVRAADACGYDSFWMPEAWETDAFSLLAELAAKTKRIGLATGIVNVFSRSPALIAMSAATLDEISGGRFRLGLGTSGARVIEDLHGIPFRKPITRLNEAIQIIRLLLAGDRVDFDGECFKLKRFKLGFKPVRSEIPIYVAALSPQSLRRFGRIADGWLPTHWPLERLGDGIKEIHAGASEAGRDPAEIEIAPFVNVVVDNDVEAARKVARVPLAYYIGGMGDFYRASLARLGYQEEANRIQELWQSGKRKGAISAVTDNMVDAIAVCGSLDKCRDRLDQMPVYGATLPVVSIPAAGSTREKCRVLEQLIVQFE
jgi:F420-dependent oxidoreductase-like protein